MKGREGFARLRRSSGLRGRGTQLRLAILLAIGAAVRIAWCAYAARPPAGMHDPSLYVIFGQRLSEGAGYTLIDGSPTAYFPVGYPLVLAAAFLVVPSSWNLAAVVAVNIAAQLAVIVGVYVLTRWLTRALGRGSDAPALVAAALVAVWPNLVVNSAVALTESVFTTLLLAVVTTAVVGVDASRRLTTRRLVVVGVLLGAAAYVRPTVVLLVPALLLAWAHAGVGWRRALTATIQAGAVAAVALVPWVGRNVVVMDAAVVSTNVGDNLCMSRRPGGSGGFEFPNARCNSGPFDTLPRPAFEVERDAHGRRLAWEFVGEHPVEEVRQWFRRLGFAVRSDDDGVTAVESYGTDPFLSATGRDIVRDVSNRYYAVVGGVGVAGLLLVAWTRRPGGAIVALAPASVLLAVMVSFGDPRFKVPALPFAAIGVGVLVDVALGLAKRDPLTRTQRRR